MFRAVPLGADTPDYPLGNPIEVSNVLAASINQLLRGKLEPKIGNALGYLATVLLKALEQGPLENRLAKIESTLASYTEQQSGEMTQ